MQTTCLIAIMLGIGLAAAGALAAPGAKWTLRIEWHGVGRLDPALAESPTEWQIHYATCLNLVNQRSARNPRGGGLVPEAAPWPRISADGRTYTFVVRPTFTRFSNGEAVGPASFARAIARIRNSRNAAWAQRLMEDIQGAHARGSRLTIRLRRPARDFLARLATPYFCSMSRTMPGVAEYETRPFPAAGPYYVAVANDRRVLLRTNRHYRGPRPHRAATIEVTSPKDPLSFERVESGEVDLTEGFVPPEWMPTTARFELTPQPGIVALLFGTAPGQPFANPRLRKAVALAVDRAEIAGDSTPTDALVLQQDQKHRPKSVYRARPSADDLRRARALAEGLVPISVRGRMSAVGRGGSLRWQRGLPFTKSLRAIGIDAGFALTAVCDSKADFYLAFIPALYADAASTLRSLAEGLGNSCYWPQSFDTRWRRALDRALSKGGPARLRRMSALELYLIRDAAIAVGMYRPHTRWLVASRIGCFRPHAFYEVDLGSLCLRS